MAYEGVTILGTTPLANTVTATIANAGSLSAAVDCGGGGIVRLQMPATWTAAALTFQVSDDAGVTFQNLYDAAGNEYTVQAVQGHTIVLNPTDFAAVGQIKIRSGTSGAPVTQGQQSVVTLITRPFA